MFSKDAVEVKLNSVLLIKAEQPMDESLISVGTVYADIVTLNLPYWEYLRGCCWDAMVCKPVKSPQS